VGAESYLPIVASFLIHDRIGKCTLEAKLRFDHLPVLGCPLKIISLMSCCLVLLSKLQI